MMNDEQTDEVNRAQLKRAIAESVALWEVLDGKDPLESWGALPDTRPE